MTNRYQTPDVLKVGEAQDVILDQKESGVLDSFTLPFANDAQTMDDFDE